MYYVSRTPCPIRYSTVYHTGGRNGITGASARDRESSRATVYTTIDMSTSRNRNSNRTRSTGQATSSSSLCKHEQRQACYHVARQCSMFRVPCGVPAIRGFHVPTCTTLLAPTSPSNPPTAGGPATCALGRVARSVTNLSLGGYIAPPDGDPLRARPPLWDSIRLWAGRALDRF
jgi:hypothetical protein